MKAIAGTFLYGLCIAIGGLLAWAVLEHCGIDVPMPMLEGLK